MSRVIWRKNHIHKKHERDAARDNTIATLATTSLRSDGSTFSATFSLSVYKVTHKEKRKGKEILTHTRAYTEKSRLILSAFLFISRKSQSLLPFCLN